jgi:hypothetical protein
MHLSLEKESLVRFLQNLDLITQQSILSISKNKIESIVSTPDNTLFLYSEWEDEKINVDNNLTLHIPDVKRLLNLIRYIEEPTISLDVGPNSLKYKSKDIKFTYHLFEEGLISPCQLKPEKIKSFETDFEFTLTKAEYQKLTKASAFSGDVNKIYFYTNEEGVFGEITDKAKHNIDSFGCTIGNITKGTTLNPISLNFDNFKLLQSNWQVCTVSINQQMGACIVTIVENYIMSTYIFTSFSQ